MEGREIERERKRKRKKGVVRMGLGLGWLVVRISLDYGGADCVAERRG